MKLSLKDGMVTPAREHGNCYSHTPPADLPTPPSHNSVSPIENSEPASFSPRQDSNEISRTIQCYAAAAVLTTNVACGNRQHTRRPLFDVVCGAEFWMDLPQPLDVLRLPVVRDATMQSRAMLLVATC